MIRHAAESRSKTQGRPSACHGGAASSVASARRCRLRRHGRPKACPTFAHALRDLPLRVRRDVRADDRRPRAARRHVALRPGRARPHRLRRRVQVRRREGAPRGHGSKSRGPARACPRLRAHECACHRPHGHLQSRHRPEGRPHRRHRQGRQPRRDGGRHPRNGCRGDHGSHRRRRPRAHRRCARHPRPLHLPADRRRGDRLGRDHAARRRHRAGDGHVRDDVHARCGAPRDDAPGDGRAAAELRVPGQRQHRGAGGSRRGRDRGRLRLQAARGLGHHARGDRLLPRGRRRAGRAGVHPHRHAQRERASSRRASRPSRAGRFTPITPRAPAAATPPTSSRCAGSPT